MQTYNQTISNGFNLSVGSLSFASSDYDVQVTNDVFGFDNLSVFVNDSPSNGGIILDGVAAQFALGDSSGTGLTSTNLPTVLDLSDFTSPTYNFPTATAETIVGSKDHIFLTLTALSISEVSAAPEPSSFALLGIGAIGLIGCRRRKRKQVD